MHEIVKLKHPLRNAYCKVCNSSGTDSLRSITPVCPRRPHFVATQVTGAVRSRTCSFADSAFGKYTKPGLSLMRKAGNVEPARSMGVKIDLSPWQHSIASCTSTTADRSVGRTTCLPPCRFPPLQGTRLQWKNIWALIF